MQYTKGQVTIGYHTCDVYFDGNNEYFYSQRGLSGFLNKGDNSSIRFFSSKHFKASMVEGLTYFHYFVTIANSLGGKDIKGVNSKLAGEYFFHWAMRGDPLAMGLVKALMTESLTVRAAGAFHNLPKSIQDVHTFTNEQLATKERKLARDLHNLYQRACYQLKFNPSICHDYITKLVFGMTAKESRQQPLPPYTNKIWYDTSVGINHQGDAVLIGVYLEVKSRFIAYHKGTYKERINRAFLEVTDNIQLA